MIKQRKIPSIEKLKKLHKFVNESFNKKLPDSLISEIANGKNINNLVKRNKKK